jgi:predicted transposase YbfD/YdcC
LYEAVVFLSHFKDLPDPRQSGKITFPLDEVQLLCLLAVLAGAEAITDMARFGEKKLDLLCRFRPFADGTPAHDHLGDILAALDAEAFQRCFVAWVASVTGIAAEVIAIDGKTLRRSHNKKSGKPAIHMVSAFAARQRLVLGQVKVADKANEIVAIPRLLDLLAIEGAIVTIDAMGCQRGIAQKIIDKRADYVLALKGNQDSLHGDVAEQSANGFQHTTISRDRTRGRRSWPHRDPRHSRHPRRYLATETPCLARAERGRHGRRQPGIQPQDRARTTSPHLKDRPE